MTVPKAPLSSADGGAGRCAGALLLCAGLVLAPPLWAQGPGNGGDRSTLRSASPAWSDLRADQRQALAPLRAEWHRLDDPQRLKWIEVANRLPSMKGDERELMQSRMQEWASLSPEQRVIARQRYHQAQRVDPAERRARWQEYQSLSPEERRQWADRSAERNRPAEKSSARPADSLTIRGGSGATTRPLDPPGRPAGRAVPATPRIAVSPSLVDQSTLLPRSGPQGTAGGRDGRDAGGAR